MILFIGALLGCFSVAFGAYASHGLRDTVTDEQFSILMTALDYHQLHTVVIIALGLTLISSSKFSQIATLKWTSVLFIAGVLLFSFSIYCSVLFEIPLLLKATPVGGTLMIIAWLLLAITGLIARKKDSR